MVRIIREAGVEMLFIYNYIFLPLVFILKPILKMILPKFKDREDAVRETLKSLDSIDKSKKTIWFHAASMGEFEQAKPVIEMIKNERNDINIVCSLFSPSGYNTQKNYTYADAVFYLPLDTKLSVKYLLDIITPKAIILVRYEIWLNLLTQSHNRNIPLYLIDATFPSGMLGGIKSFINTAFIKFDKIYAVNQEETDKFINAGIRQVETLADTRLDRIAGKVKEARKAPILDKSIFNGRKVLVAGSSWQPDEQIITKAVNEIGVDKLSVIYVPHEPTPEHIKELQALVPNTILLSKLEKLDITEQTNLLKLNHIIVDSIGKLLGLYASADIAYIGGAFGVGVHSVTEPAGYAIPLITGKNNTNSPDAPKLEQIGALKSVKDSQSLKTHLTTLLENTVEYRKISSLSGNYVNSALGSSKVIVEEILERI